MPLVRPDNELAELRAQIARDMQAVENKLKTGDTGETTRELQKKIVENLDRLLKKSQEPSPNDSKSSSSRQNNPSPSTGNSKTGENKPSSTRRERREAQRRQQSPSRGTSAQQAQSQPQPGAGQPNDPMGTTRQGTVRTGPADSMADVAKDIWGHLPESLRQEVDHYYREQFMPRYRDLLQQYYLRLAETDRRSRSNP